MKKYLIFFSFLLLLGSNVYAQDGIQFTDGTWKELLARAGREDKLIFVDAYTVWCGPCKKMSRDVFTQKEVGDFFNAKFVNAKIDMEKGEGLNLARQFSIRAYPTLLFVDSKGEVVHRSVGYHTTDLLLDLGEAALDPNRNIGTITQKYEAGDRSPDLLYNLAIAKLEAMDDSYPEVAEAYLKTQPDWDSQKNMEFIYRMVHDVDSEMFGHMMNNRDAFEAHLGQQAIAAKMNELIQNEVANAENEADLKGVEDLYKKLYPSEGAEMAGRIKMGYYAQREDWPNFARVADDHYKKFPAQSWDELNEIAWIFYEEAKSKKELKSALCWAKESVKMESNYYNNDTLAALYYRLGKKGKARKTAKKAIAMAEKAGEDHSATDVLLENIEKM